MTTALSVLIRPIVPGATKTRLIPALGPVAAAHLYRAFVQDAVRAALGLAGVQSTLWVAGPPQHASLASLDLHLPRRGQPSRVGLATRILAALAGGCEECDAALAIGSDAPTLPAPYLQQACGLLDRRSCVLGPAADGGFYAVGVRRDDLPALTDALSHVRWSTPWTLRDTLAGARRAGLRVHLLPPWYDVDDAHDLNLLRLHLALRPGTAPATEQALRTLPSAPPATAL